MPPRASPNPRHLPTGALSHGHRGPHPDHPPPVHRRSEGGGGLRDTLAKLFADLETRHAGIQDRLIDKANGDQLRRFVNVYLNDEDVRFLDGIDTKLSDGDSITILPAVAGGMA